MGRRPGNRPPATHQTPTRTPGPAVRPAPPRRAHDRVGRHAPRGRRLSVRHPPAGATATPSATPVPGDLLRIPGEENPPPNAPSGSFSFGVEITAESGPPITVTRISQPHAALSATSTPRPPFRTRAGSPRTIVITMHMTECANAPRNAGLPFLDVTLRNTRAIEDHSFILGERYAHYLSAALRAACGNDSTSSPKPQNATEITAVYPAGSHYADGANRPEFHAPTH